MSTRNGVNTPMKPTPSAPPPAGPDESLDAAIRAHVRTVYERHGRNLTETAAALGVSRNTLYRRLRQRDAAEQPPA